MSFLAKILPRSGGASPKEEQLIRQEAVEKLCNRLLHASLLEDRRAAAQGLRSISKHHRLEIGSVGMPSLISALKRDAEDVELTRSILETFISICSDAGGDAETTMDLHAEFCEILLKDKEVIEIMLGCLEQGNQYVRFDVLQLMSVLEDALPAKVPSAILASPSGLARLLELLEDSREIIRNEAILLLRRLTESSPEIQKISVFEGTFERIYDLVDAAGGIFSGDIVVEDSLKIVHNLLRYNPSGQNYFLESPCLAKTFALLTATDSDAAWNTQKCRNFIAVIEIPCIFLNRDNPKLEHLQNSWFKANLFEPLVNSGLSTAVPSGVRRVALEALGLLMWQNAMIQDVFARHVITTREVDTPSVPPAPSAPPVPAVLSAIRLSVDCDHLGLRIAATNALSAYLCGNTDGQLVVTATFKSPHVEGSPTMNEQSAGSVIIEHALDVGSIHRDPFRIWFPSILLSHILKDNDQCKMIALNHQYSPDGDETPLYSRILWNLVDCVKDPRHVHSSVAYLVLIATWMYRFPAAITFFLAEGSNVQFLVELINQNSTADAMVQGCAAFVFGLAVLFHAGSEGPFSRNVLIDIVKSRIGVDVFTARMVRTRDTLNKFLVTSDTDKDSVLFDRPFAELFLELYKLILQLFSKGAPTRALQYNSPVLKVDKSVETLDGGYTTAEHTLHFEMESLHVQVQELQSSRPSPHEKNVESKCAYLASENGRLHRLVEAYQTQIFQVEKDHEELLIILASYDNELKQLRQHLTIAERDHEPSEGFLTSNPSDIDLQNQLNGIERDNTAAVGNIRYEDIESRTQCETINHCDQHGNIDPYGQHENIVDISPTIPEGSLYQETPETPVKKLSNLLTPASPATATQDV